MNPVNELCSDAHEYPWDLTDKICQLLCMEQSNGKDWDVSEHHSRDIPSPSSETDVVDNADDGEPFAGFSLIERMQKLKSEYGDDIFHYIRKLHKHFGHCHSTTCT